MLIVRIRDSFEQVIVFADRLQKCGIRTMAMEATGVDGIPLFELREARGREVCLVNAEHVRPVPGRKSDGPDCRRLRFLHSVGRLHASFRPALAICAVRTRWRHRDSLIQVASAHRLRLQKALDQMNVRRHRAVTDITGATGLAFRDAIVAGERDPQKLAAHRDHRCKQSVAEIAPR
jgi:transposase